MKKTAEELIGKKLAEMREAGFSATDPTLMTLQELYNQAMSSDVSGSEFTEKEAKIFYIDPSHVTMLKDGVCIPPKAKFENPDKQLEIAVNLDPNADEVVGRVYNDPTVDYQAVQVPFTGKLDYPDEIKRFKSLSNYYLKGRGPVYVVKSDGDYLTSKELLGQTVWIDDINCTIKGIESMGTIYKGSKIGLLVGDCCGKSEVVDYQADPKSCCNNQQDMCCRENTILANPYPSVSGTIRISDGSSRLENAVSILQNHLRKDRDLWGVYQANIAMAFYDEVHRVFGDRLFPSGEALHDIANSSADRFLRWFTYKAEEPNGSGLSKYEQSLEKIIDSIRNEPSTLKCINKLKTYIPEPIYKFHEPK